MIALWSHCDTIGLKISAIFISFVNCFDFGNCMSFLGWIVAHVTIGNYGQQLSTEVGVNETRSVVVWLGIKEIPVTNERYKKTDQEKGW